MMPRLKWFAWVAWFLLPAALSAQPDHLLARIWDGVQQAQAQTATACGTVVETRSSPLMARPLVLKGKFCTEGAVRFWLEYLPPHALTVRFNTDLLNATGSDGQTEILEIGSGVRRAQATFSREGSIAGLQKDFSITVTENEREYEMKFVPRTEAFRKRLNFLVVKLNKRTFLPRSIEVDGRSGVNSVFAIDITSTNEKLPAAIFEVKKSQ
jgi:hypothetical protein